MNIVDEIVQDLHLQGLYPMQIFRRLLPIFGPQVVTHAIAMHTMRLRIIQALENGEEDPINVVIEHTLQNDESVPTPAKLKLTPGQTPLDEKCVICMEDKIEHPVTLPCGHSFCHGCIQHWFTEKNTCPTCRQCVDKERKRKRSQPGEELPIQTGTRRVVRRRLTFRARPRCRRCGELMRGHSRERCTQITQTAHV